MKRLIFALAAALALLAGCSSTPQPLPATEPPVTEVPVEVEVAPSIYVVAIVAAVVAVVAVVAIVLKKKKK